MPEFINYVVGFLIDGGNVALILKETPQWQKGLLNGLGGKIEVNESARDAMRREFKEESGADITDWRQYAVLQWSRGNVYVFVAHASAELKSLTDEKVDWYPIDDVHFLNVVPNVRWLLPLALDHDKVSAVATFPH